MKRSQALALLAVALAGGIAPLLRPVQELERAAIDSRFHLRGPLPGDCGVVVVAIDDATERKWRAIPKAFWGAELAKVIQRIDSGGASSLGIDLIVGVDADRYLASHGLRATPNGDLDNAIANMGGRVLLGTVTGDDLIAPLGDTSDGRELVSLNTSQTSGGVVRQLPRVDRTLNPPLACLAARLAQSLAGDERPIQINYSGSPNLSVVSALDLLENRAAPNALTGKRVLLGETYAASTDRQDTPFGRVPGVLIHAEAARTVLANRELWTSTPILDTLLGAVVGAVFGLLAIRQTVGRYLLGALVFAAVWSLLAVGLFVGRHIVLPWYWPALLALLGPPLTIFPIKINDERRERLWARAQWGQMVSDEFVAILEAKRSGGVGAMETFDAALLFLDVVDFSRLSIQLADQPGTLLAGLNAVFGEAIAEIQSQGGTVLNFMGDGLCAMFVQRAADPPGAARTAALASALRIVQRGRAGTLGPDPIWQVRLGLSYGEVTLALVGSKTRKQMTVYGPAVNMASRLEQAGKDLNPERTAQEMVLTSDLVLSADYESLPALTPLAVQARNYRPKGWREPLCILYLPRPSEK